MFMFKKICSRVSPHALRWTRPLSTLPIPKGLKRDDFLAHPSIQKELVAYKQDLMQDNLRGVPHGWASSTQCFDRVHKIHHENFSYLYHSSRFISKDSFIGLYIRCSMNDLGDVIYKLFDSDTKVDIHETNPSLPYTPYIRLSWIDRISNNLCYLFRTDASYHPRSLRAGYGCVIANSSGQKLGYYYGVLMKPTRLAKLAHLTSGELMTLLELMAISKSLQCGHRLHQTTIKFLTDSDNVVQVLEGKLGKFYGVAEIMNEVCIIGYYLKILEEFGFRHIYRELNADADFLAKEGAYGKKVTEQMVLDKDVFSRIRTVIPVSLLALIPKSLPTSPPLTPQV